MANMRNTKKALSPGQGKELLEALKARFEKNMNRHQGLEWPKVQANMEANAEKLWSLNEMERTGGEPDIVGHAFMIPAATAPHVEQRSRGPRLCVVRGFFYPQV